MGISNPTAASVSTLAMDADLTLGAFNITLDGGQTVDEVDISARKIKSMFYSVEGALITGPGSSKKGDYITYLFDGASDKAELNIIVPADYKDTPKIKIIYIRVTAEPIVDYELCWTTPNAIYTGTSEDVLNLTHTGADTNNDVGIMDIGATFSGLASGDVIGLKITFDTGNFYWLGAIFEYST